MSKTAAAIASCCPLPAGGLPVVVAALVFLPAAPLAANPDPALRRSDQIDLRRLGKVSEDERSVLRVEWRAGLAGVDEARSIADMFDQLRRLEAGIRDVKKREGTAFFRPDRVAQVIDKNQQANPGPLKNQHVAHIWREIMSACLALEAPQRVAVLGPAGTFCEQAAIEFFGGAADLIYCANFDEVFHATAAGSAQYGVVGVENSTEGMVTRSLDLFLHSPTHVIGEVTLLVRHNLLRLENSLEGIEVVLAHPLALAQCQAWLTKNLPHAERRPVSSNAEGARLATTNPAWSGLASERAATQFGLHIAAHARSEGIIMVANNVGEFARVPALQVENWVSTSK